MNKEKIVGFEISILIIAIFAFSYFIGGAVEVSAELVIESTGCCAELKDTGAICQDNVLGDDCADGFSPNALCVDTVDCQIGCCVDNIGICSPNAPKVTCEDGGGTWEDDSYCNVPICESACCVLGTQAQFVTEPECNAISSALNLQKDFRQDLQTEYACYQYATTQIEGACVFEQSYGEDTCIYKKKSDCDSISGEFYAGTLCSTALPEVCLAKYETKCIDSKDEIFWFDSCNNKEEVLVPGGNCDKILFGTTCDYDDDGDTYCKDLNCYDIPYNINGDESTRNHGESWCVYEGAVGDGRDVPGTSHYRYICSEGEVLPEICSEGRNEVCVEVVDGGVSTGDCIANFAPYCLYVNEFSDSEMRTKCNGNPHCKLIRLSGGNLNINPDALLCVPNYPVAGDNFCNLADYSCIRSDEESWGSFECENGCNCDNAALQNRLVDFCVSLGDCGDYTNPAGEVTTEGFEWRYSVRVEEPGFLGAWSVDETTNYGPYKIGAGHTAAFAVPSRDAIAPGDFEHFMDNAVPSLFIEPPLDYELDQESFYEFADLVSTIGLFAGPWGWLVTAIVEIIGLFGGGKQTWTYEYNCESWEPPSGVDSCELCNEDPEKCTQYKCFSLGYACGHVDLDNDGFGECFGVEVGDPSAPVISPLDFSHLSYENVSYLGFVMKKDDGECVDQYEIFEFGLKTDERAKCRYDVEDKGYNQMWELFDTESSYGFNHTSNLHFIYDEGEVRIYARCINLNEKDNDISYIMDVCINTVDFNAPNIEHSIPEKISYMKHGDEELNLTILLNEPAFCRWSRERGRDYSVMENNFSCLRVPMNHPGLEYNAFTCTTEIDALIEDNNEIYVRCQDISENLNTNTEDIDFLFKRSVSPLSIEILEPEMNEELVYGGDISVTFSVKTSGGAEDKALCSYGFSGDSFSLFLTDIAGETVIHTQEFNTIGEGEYTVDIDCSDSALNVAENQTNFTIRIDREAPKVTRVYNKHGSLVILTDEYSTCAYSLNSCRFEFSNGTLMAGNDRYHTTPFDEKKYYVKCKDIFDNSPGDCSITVEEGY